MEGIDPETLVVLRRYARLLLQEKLSKSFELRLIVVSFFRHSGQVVSYLVQLKQTEKYKQQNL